MPMVYFGPYWDAPAVDDAIQGATPVGQLCIYCPDPIAEGDRGFMMNAVREGEDGELVGSVEPAHLECFLRMTVGSVAVLEGRCRCLSGEDTCHAGTVREQGRATMEWCERRRAPRNL